MTKSELIRSIVASQDLPARDVTRAVNHLLEYMAQELNEGRRIEVRGFGHFGLRHRKACTKRNPKTCALATVEARSVPYFKAGKALKDALNCSVDHLEIE